MKIMILGASYGSLLSTKLLMAGHEVMLICRENSAELVNREGTEVRIKLRDEDTHRSIFSRDLPGTLKACTPADAPPEQYDMIALAMQEPQYTSPDVRGLMKNVAESGKPCLSIMNMPPLPFLKRVSALAEIDLSDCYETPEVWDGFKPDLMSLCSPDPQAFRPQDEENNVLQVGLPTNFKAASFASSSANAMLNSLEEDIAAVRLDGKDVPVKLRVSDSLFVPLAKWSMLMAGNYRCIGRDKMTSIKDAVHSDLAASETVYGWVSDLARRLGADEADQVPFEKYAAAAQNLINPSSVARAIDGGIHRIERVDRLIQRIGRSQGRSNETVDEIVDIVDARLARLAA